MAVSEVIKTVCIQGIDIPTKVFTIGGDVDSHPKELILVIPGKQFIKAIDRNWQDWF